MSESRPWRGVLDTTLCDAVYNDLCQVNGFCHLWQTTIASKHQRII